MPIIHKLQQRDLEALETLYPDKNFETLYLEHLQELRHVLVANQKDKEGIRNYFGYASILWQSSYTSFWRHNIPEIDNLYVAKDHRRQGIATELIKTIEVAARKKNYEKIGIRLERIGEFAIAQKFHESSGYKIAGFEYGTEEKIVWIIKSLP